LRRTKKLVCLLGAARVSPRPAAASGAARRCALSIISAYRKHGRPNRVVVLFHEPGARTQ